MCVRWRAVGRVVLLSVWRSGQRARPLCPMAGEKGVKGESERYQRHCWSGVEGICRLWDILSSMMHLTFSACGCLPLWRAHTF